MYYSTKFGCMLYYSEHNAQVFPVIALRLAWGGSSRYSSTHSMVFHEELTVQFDAPAALSPEEESLLPLSVRGVIGLRGKGKVLKKCFEMCHSRCVLDAIGRVFCILKSQLFMLWYNKTYIIN
jgi:hypothetical protein